MKRSHAIGTVAGALILSTQALPGQTGAHYCDFQLGKTASTRPSCTDLRMRRGSE
jgi:hypothetical protein